MPFSGYDFMHLAPGAQRRAPRAGAREPSRASIVVFGAKGGVGTTTLAYNIAAAIAAEGQQRVALIDGSLQFGDVRALLRVDESAPSILQLPTNKVQKTDLEEVMYRDKSGVDVLLAPPRIEMAEMIIAKRPREADLAHAPRSTTSSSSTPARQVDDILLAFLDAQRRARSRW